MSLKGAAEFNNEKLQEYKSQFGAYLRKGDQIMGADELKALSVGSDPDGGYTVHPDMSGAIAAKVFDTSPMRAYAAVQVIGTDALEGLYDDDEASAAWVQETGARPATDTPQMGAWRIPVHELYANPQATQKVLDDSNINIEAWLNGKVADKMGRTEATAFVTGNGVGKPRGFTTYANGTSIREQVEQVKTGVNGDFPAAPDGGDTLITALYALKAQYRANASWFMNRGSLRASLQRCWATLSHPPSKTWQTLPQVRFPSLLATCARPIRSWTAKASAFCATHTATSLT